MKRKKEVAEGKGKFVKCVPAKYIFSCNKYMKLRQLQKTDYNSYLILINNLRPTYFTKKEFCCNLDIIQKYAEIWVIETDHILIATGTILYETKFIHNICKSAHIEDICTLQDYRCMGFGKTLIRHLIKEAKKNNCYKINLVCDDDISTFYKSCNFEKKGVHMSYLI